MISEFVFCDICGTKIEKAMKHKWHNINVVRHLRPASAGKDHRSLTASFHVCTDDFKDFLLEVVGINVKDEVHKASLKNKIGEKLRIAIHPTTYEGKEE